MRLGQVVAKFGGAALAFRGFAARAPITAVAASARAVGTLARFSISDACDGRALSKYQQLLGSLRSNLRQNTHISRPGTTLGLGAGLRFSTTAVSKANRSTTQPSSSLNGGRMITGSITYDNVWFGKLRFDYISPEDHDLTDHLENGKFTIWSVRKLHRIDVPIERLTIQKMQEMRTQLLQSLDKSIAELDPTVNNLHENYMVVSDPAQTSPEVFARIREADHAQSQLKLMRSMLESWDYDEHIRHGAPDNPAAA